MTGQDQRRLVVGAIVLDDEQRILAARRSRPASLVGRWEFPGGKVEDGEEPVEALERELLEELNIEVVVHAEFAPVSGSVWPVDEAHDLRVWFCSMVAGLPTPGDSHDEVTWATRDELLALAWAPADEPIAQALAGE